MSTLKVDSITDSAGTGAPDFPNNATGIGFICAAGYLSANQTGLTSGSETVIAFDTEEFDSSGIFDTGTYRLTPTQAGIYLISCTSRVAPSAANAINQATTVLRKNGSIFKVGNEISHTSTAYGGRVRTTVSALVYANGAGDYFEFSSITSVTSGTYQINLGQDSTWFYAIKIA